MLFLNLRECQNFVAVCIERHGRYITTSISLCHRVARSEHAERLLFEPIDWEISITIKSFIYSIPIFYPWCAHEPSKINKKAEPTSDFDLRYIIMSFSLLPTPVFSASFKFDERTFWSMAVSLSAAVRNGEVNIDLEAFGEIKGIAGDCPSTSAGRNTQMEIGWKVVVGACTIAIFKRPSSRNLPMDFLKVRQFWLVISLDLASNDWDIYGRLPFE